MAKSDRDRRRSAVALTYSPGAASPQVVAKGYGVVAQNIINTAQTHGLPLHESEELTQLLMSVDIDAYIPEPLFEAVAQVLAWAYSIEERRRESPME